jgi:L-fuculose-phosphate aldolase
MIWKGITSMTSIPEQLAMVGRRMFDRKLTDMAGGNISAREGDLIYISPRYSGSIYHWQLEPEQLICAPFLTDDIFSHPELSRESKAHIAIYRNFPNVQAVIHAHAFHIQPFAATCRPIPPVLEANDKFGVIPVARAAHAHSADLAENVVEALRGQEDRIGVQAAAVVLPRHGIIVAGKSLLATIDALERIDWNCWCILSQRLLGDP